MALIIKGDMPQGCWQGDAMNRTFCDWYDYCRGRCIPPKGFVPSDCPIIGEIPDSHGDIIDIDLAIEDFAEKHCRYGACNGKACKDCDYYYVIGFFKTSIRKVVEATE